MSNKILIVDDDLELCELLKDFLQREGFTISMVHDGEAGLESCREIYFDAIILDVMLPKLQGFDVLKQLRKFSNIPVLMLTARGEDTDRIVGLEIGADDYLPKPCNPRELAARLRAILRRVETPAASQKAQQVITYGSVELHSANRVASCNGETLELTSTEFNILLHLTQNAGQAVEKEALMVETLGRKLTAHDRSIDVHISNIRKKISQLDEHITIKNIRNVGYQLCFDTP